MTFNQTGTFEAHYAAEAWCKTNGISCGSMERGHPIGLIRGDALIAKWSNMTKAEQEQCDGTMTSQSFRNGPVTISMKPLYSTTTFKDNSDPIMLNHDGKRSVFCDVDE